MHDSNANPRPVASGGNDDAARGLDEAVRRILEGGSGRVGPAFFDAMTRQFASLLSADMVFIGELLDTSPKSVQTLSYHVDGSARESLRYPLPGTPCATVLEGSVRSYPRGVAEAFPDDTFLADDGVEAYIGVPLRDATGQAIGLASALFRHELEDTELAETLILVFAERMGAELQRHRTERERRRLERQVQDAQRLESLGLLAGSIAHDFNNLLCAMLGSAELALLEIPEEHVARRDLVTLSETARRATELCRQLLEYSGDSPLALRPLDLARLARDMESLLRVSIKGRAELHLELPPELPAIEGDSSQLGQVVLNLVLNAAEAGRSGDNSITVSTRVLTVDDTSPIETVPTPLCSGEYVALSVEDRGLGMDEDTRRRVFEPFFSTKPEGRGLGLAATMGIVRAHRGGLLVESTPGQGTRFVVLLPASTRSAPPPSPRTPRAPERRGTGTVLLVDDEAPVRTVGRRMLERLGYRAQLAATGEQALALVESGECNPDLVLLDLTMPGLGGPATLSRLRALRPDVEYVVMSGYREDEAATRFDIDQSCAFLQKPFHLSQLERLLHAILGET